MPNLVLHRDVKLGKRVATPDPRDFQFADLVSTAQPPKAPPEFGHEGLITAWGMLGNDTVGDCVIAGAGHETEMWNKEAGRTVTISAATAIKAYSEVTGYNPKDPNTDQGTDMGVAAKWRRAKGMPDDAGNRHKIAAYLSIKPGNFSQLKQAAWLFGAVGIGIEFPASAMDQFNAGQPWDVVKGSQIEGGHYIPIVAVRGNYVEIVTWGQIQKVTLAFLAKYCDEAYAYVSLEALENGKSLEGFDTATLEHWLSQLK